jgi:hypothetical protein
MAQQVFENPALFQDLGWFSTQTRAKLIDTVAAELQRPGFPKKMSHSIDGAG